MLSGDAVVAGLWIGGAASLAVMSAVLLTRKVTVSSTETLAFCGVSVGATVWAWAYGLQLSAGTLPAKLAYNDVLWIGISLVGASWPLFALVVSGYRQRLTPRLVGVLVGVPALTALLVMTNPVHEFMFADAELVAGPVRTRVSVTPGIGFFGFYLYSFVVNLAVLGVLFHSIRRVEGIARARRGLVFLSGLFPFAVGTAAILTIDSPESFIDPTPLSFTVTTVITGIAVARYRLLDSVSMARDRAVNELPDPVVIVDADRTVRFGNPAARTLFGFDDTRPVPAAEVFSASPELVRALDDDREQLEIQLRVRSGSVADADEPRGTPTTFDVSIQRLPDGDGTVLVFRDISERERAEHYLTVLNRLLRHDLRNDASIIQGHLDLLRGEVDDDANDTIRKAFDTIQRRTEGLISLSEQARAVDTLSVEHTTETHHLGDLLTTRRDQLTEEHPGLDLSVSLPAEPVYVAGVSALPSAVDNLLENAAEHSDRSRPEVHVAVTLDDEEVVLTIADDGPGIPEYDRKVLLGEPGALERASGLGLWLVNQIITASGGAVSVADREPRGTEIELRLQRASPEEAGSATQAPELTL